MTSVLHVLPHIQCQGTGQRTSVDLVQAHSCWGLGPLHTHVPSNANLPMAVPPRT